MAAARNNVQQQDLGVGDPAPTFKRISPEDLSGYRLVAHDAIQNGSDDKTAKLGLLISRLCVEVEELGVELAVARIDMHSAQRALSNLRRKL